MGLDAFVRRDLPEATADTPACEELWYGRKKNEIHGWMQRQSGIPADDFNCERLPLTAAMMDHLEQDIRAKALVATAGFFFGCANDCNEVTLAAEALLKATRASLARNEQPYYFSWW